jgi:integrase/recombinase XerC
LNIRVFDIDFDNRMILTNGKGNKQRYVLFNEKLHEMLKKNISRQSIKGKLIKIKERRVGDIFQEVSGKVGYRIHPHMLRHAFASAHERR